MRNTGIYILGYKAFRGEYLVERSGGFCSTIWFLRVLEREEREVKSAEVRGFVIAVKDGGVYSYRRMKYSPRISVCLLSDFTSIEMRTRKLAG